MIKTGDSGGDAGAGKMMAVMVFITGFSIMLIFLLYSFSPILNAAHQVGQQEISIEGFTAADLATYEMYSTGLGAGVYLYNITPAMKATYLEFPSISMGAIPLCIGGWSNMTFNAGVTIRMYIDTDGEFYFWCHSGWWDSKTVHLTFADMTAKSAVVNGMQRCNFVITLDQSYTVFFLYPTGVDPYSVAVTTNGFSVALGQSVAQSYESTGNNAWNYVTGIITFNLPNGGIDNGGWVDRIVSIVFDSALIFIAYWAITRLIGALMV